MYRCAQLPASVWFNSSCQVTTSGMGAEYTRLYVFSRGAISGDAGTMPDRPTFVARAFRSGDPIQIGNGACRDSFVPMHSISECFKLHEGWPCPLILLIPTCSTTSRRYAGSHLRGQARSGPAQDRGTAGRDSEQRQLLEHRHRREGRHTVVQRRRRADVGLHSH